MRVENACLVLRVMGIFIMCISILPGCQKKAAEKSAPASGKVTIRYVNFENLPEQQEMRKEIIGKFEAEYPDIKIKYDYASGPEKILVEIAGGTAPDVFYGGNWDAPGLVPKGAVANLTPFIEEDKLNMDDYFKICVDTFTYNGNLYCFPLHFSTTALFYNKDLFDKASLLYPDETWDWDKFLDAAKALTRDVDGDGRIDQYGTIGTMWPLWVKGNGGTVFDEEENRCLLDRPEAVEAIQFFIDLRHKYGVCPELKTSAQREESTIFMTGRVGMYISATAFTTMFQNITAFDWDIAPMPKGKTRVSGLAVGGFYITEQSKHKREAWEFVKFYCGQEGQNILARMKNCVPAHRGAALTVFVVPPPNNTMVFIDALEYAQTTYKYQETLEVLQQVISLHMEELFLEGKDVEQKLKRITSEVNKRLVR